MTLQINKSAIDRLPYDFEKAVAAHIEALNAHRFVGDVAPNAPGEIEAAIRRIQHPIEDQKPDDFVADYEIIDDVTVVECEKSPAEWRAELLQTVRTGAEDAKAKAISPARSRLLAMDFQNASGKPEKDQTPGDKSAIEQYRAMQAKFSKIQYHAALMDVQIEETPDEMLPHWAMEPFPEV